MAKQHIQIWRISGGKILRLSWLSSIRAPWPRITQIIETGNAFSAPGRRKKSGKCEPWNSHPVEMSGRIPDEQLGCQVDRRQVHQTLNFMGRRQSSQMLASAPNEL
jgi:hypothetical protein